MTMANSTMTSSPRTGVSLRKTNKPLMEKRRRARINESLLQLKSLVIQSNKKDSSQFNKLEKADILELTVKHLRHIQNQQQQQLMSQSANNDPSTNSKYQAGFMECAKEVMNYLGQSQNFSEDTKSRVISHLASCIQLANEPSFSDRAQATPMNQSNASVLGQSVQSNCQLANGQVIQIVNSPFQCVKTTNVNQYPVQIAPCHSNSSVEAVHKPTPHTPASTSVPTSSESSHHIRYAQPLHIQIPPVVSPVLIPSQTQQRQQKPAQSVNITKPQSAIPNPRPLNLVHASQSQQHQDTIVTSSSLSPQRRERSVSPQPMRFNQKYSSYHQHEDLNSDFIPRSRTYSITSSSSTESELMSPLNLSHSPQYSDSQKSVKYSSPHSFQSPVYHSNEKISPSQQLYKENSFPSQYSSSHVTSVIVDGRKNIDLKYMKMVMDDDRHCFRHEGSSSPASSVGEERLWRPW